MSSFREKRSFREDAIDCFANKYEIWKFGIGACCGKAPGLPDKCNFVTHCDCSDEIGSICTCQPWWWFILVAVVVGLAIIVVIVVCNVKQGMCRCCCPMRERIPENVH